MEGHIRNVPEESLLFKGHPSHQGHGTVWKEGLKTFKQSGSKTAPQNLANYSIFTKNHKKYQIMSFNYIAKNGIQTIVTMAEEKNFPLTSTDNQAIGTGSSLVNWPALEITVSCL